MPVTVEELRDYLAGFDDNLPIIIDIDLSADVAGFDLESQIAGLIREYLDDDGAWKKMVVFQKGWQCNIGWEVRTPNIIRFQTYEFLSNVIAGWRFSMGPQKIARLTHPRFNPDDPEPGEDFAGLSTGYDPRLLPELLAGDLATWTPAPDPFSYGSLLVTAKGHEWLADNKEAVEDVPF